MHKWIAGTALAALLTAGGAGVAVAQSSPGPSTSNPPATTEAPGGNQQSQAEHPKARHARKAHRRIARHLLRGAVKTSAKTIGIPPKELAQDLKNGQSIADVARAHNVDPQKVIDALVSDANARIDKALKNGHLTQKQADALKKRAPKAAEKLVNHRRKHVVHPDTAPSPMPTNPSTTPPPTN